MPPHSPSSAAHATCLSMIGHRSQSSDDTMATITSLDDASLFMDDLFPLKEEEDAASSSAIFAASMESDMFPTNTGLDLVQLLAYEDDDDVFMMDAFPTTTYSGQHHHDTMLSDGSYSPASTDDMSDALTDVASEMSSPPPTFEEDQLTPASPSSSTYSFTSITQNGNSVATPSNSHTGNDSRPHLVKQVPSSPPAPVSHPTQPTVVAPHTFTPSMAASIPTAMLPFAFPVACFPAMNLNANQKRPLPDVLPNAPSTSLDAAMSKKSKREIRQMKNRESANRSRLRRKAQLSEMSGEVEELMTKQHELQNTVAALQAENKSLHDQNAFLRSLVTMYSDPSRGAVALPPVPCSSSSSVLPSSAAPASSVAVEKPISILRPSISLSDLESGHKTESQDETHSENDDEEEEDAEEVELLPMSKKRKSIGQSAATVSAASLGLCVSMFGLTILTDSDNGTTQAGHIRRTGRVLHSLPATISPGCSPAPIQSMLEQLWHVLTSSWTFLTTSDLAYGVFLNVLSFVVIMGLYHYYQQVFSTHRISKKGFRWENLNTKATTRRETSNRRTGAAAAVAAAKRRSVSWQDVRLQDVAATASDSDAALPRVVQVFA